MAVVGINVFQHCGYASNVNNQVLYQRHHYVGSDGDSSPLLSQSSSRSSSETDFRMDTRSNFACNNSPPVFRRVNIRDPRDMPSLRPGRTISVPVRFVYVSRRNQPQVNEFKKSVKERHGRDFGRKAHAVNESEIFLKKIGLGGRTSTLTSGLFTENGNFCDSHNGKIVTTETRKSRIKKDLYELGRQNRISDDRMIFTSGQTPSTPLSLVRTCKALKCYDEKVFSMRTHEYWRRQPRPQKFDSPITPPTLNPRSFVTPPTKTVEDDSRGSLSTVSIKETVEPILKRTNIDLAKLIGEYALSRGRQPSPYDWKLDFLSVAPGRTRRYDANAYTAVNTKWCTTIRPIMTPKESSFGEISLNLDLRWPSIAITKADSVYDRGQTAMRENDEKNVRKRPIRRELFPQSNKVRRKSADFDILSFQTENPRELINEMNQDAAELHDFINDGFYNTSDCHCQECWELWREINTICAAVGITRLSPQ
ncbi:uncharacterized protein [Ptychodera flava]|uniref:uncharacterized protein n=1 Tax=Ptychodera flava TaxID=63121 RepID=UPI00396A2DD8